MEAIFIYLYEALYGNIYLIVLGSFLWGVASILLSPCHLTSIPLIVGYLNGNEKLSLKRTFYHALIFSSGILLSILIIGLITSYSGRMLGDLGIWGNLFLSLFFIFFGLILLDLFSLPNFIDTSILSKFKKQNFLSSFLIGFIFGIGLGPCTFAFMAPMLGVIFQASSENLSSGIMMLILFALGHSLTIAIAGTFVQFVEKILKVSQDSKKILYIRRACGILVIIAGLYNIKLIIHV